MYATARQASGRIPTGQFTNAIPFQAQLFQCDPRGGIESSNVPVACASAPIYPETAPDR